MVIFIFSFNGISSKIDGKEDDKIKDALSKFYSKNKEINPNTVSSNFSPSSTFNSFKLPNILILDNSLLLGNKFLLYKGTTISNYDLTFNELANSDDKERKEMNILIIEINGTTIIEDGNSIIKSKENNMSSVS